MLRMIARRVGCGVAVAVKAGEIVGELVCVGGGVGSAEGVADVCAQAEIKKKYAIARVCLILFLMGTRLLDKSEHLENIIRFDTIPVLR